MIESCRGLSIACVISLFSATAFGQTPPAQPAAAPAPPPAPAPAPAPVAAAPAPAAAAPAPIAIAPPAGYMLVPVQQTESKPTTPVDLPYEEGRPVPPGYRLVEQQRRGLILAGALVAGIPWALSITVAAGNNFEDSTGLLLLPAVGPWLTLAAQKNNSCDSSNGSDVCFDTTASTRGVLVLDGLLQTTGAILFVIGLSTTTKKYLRNDIISAIAPTRIGRDGYGLSMHGKF